MDPVFHADGSRDGSYQQESGPEGQAEDHGAGQVRLVHDAAVGHLQRMQHGQRLLPDVVKVDAQLCQERGGGGGKQEATREQTEI